MQKKYLYPSNFYNKIYPFAKNVPVNIDGLLKSFNLNVIYRDIFGIGFIHVKTKKSFIEINDIYESKKILPFIKAFLLSHYMINKSLIENYLHVDNFFETRLGPIKHKAAFECATHLLIPSIEWEKWNRDRQLKPISIEDMADHFKVPCSIISIMLKCPYEDIEV